jgi:hypothetical protein
MKILCHSMDAVSSDKRPDEYLGPLTTTIVAVMSINRHGSCILEAINGTTFEVSFKL